MSAVLEKILSKFDEPAVLGVLATVTDEGRPWVRYLMLACDPADMTLWSTTFLQSRKCVHIKAHPDVHVTLGVRDLPSAVDYLQIEGTAEVLTDAESRRRMWTEEQSAYFSGPDDPNYAVIRITPTRIEYQTMTAMSPEVWEPTS